MSFIGFLSVSSTKYNDHLPLKMFFMRVKCNDNDKRYKTFFITI